MATDWTVASNIDPFYNSLTIALYAMNSVSLTSLLNMPNSVPDGTSIMLPNGTAIAPVYTQTGQSLSNPNVNIVVSGLVTSPQVRDVAFARTA
jgi:hypothetical protein